MLEQNDLLCHHCDEKSNLLPNGQLTRLRVLNLCCSGEEQLIRRILTYKKGIEKIDINLIGRTMTVKHCGYTCCITREAIVELLNEQYLGASLDEVGENTVEEIETINIAGMKVSKSLLKYNQIAYNALIWLLFFIGLVIQFSLSLINWIYIPAIIIGTLPILRSTYITIRQSRIDINILILFAIGGALAIGEYFDASLLVALYNLAELIERMLMDKIREKVTATAPRLPTKAFVISMNQFVDVHKLKMGDRLAIRTGEVIMADGVVVKGKGSVNESAVTGEANPISKEVGMRVISGTIVQSGYIELEIDTEMKESTLNRLHQALHDVQSEQGNIQQLINQFAVYWIPFMILTTVSVIVIGGGVTNEWIVYLNRGLVILVLSCPCAILIAAPVPTACAVALASKQGILIKGSSKVEELGCIDTVALDKTGTMTKGRFVVDRMLKFYNESDVDEDWNPLKFATAIELKSTHPLANAVVSTFITCASEMSESVMPNVRDFQVIPGVGISGWVEQDNDWVHVMIGNERSLLNNGGKSKFKNKVNGEQYQEFALQCSREGKALLMIAIDDEVLVVMALSDEIREDASDFIKDLKGLGMKIMMLTGDHEDVAKQVSRDIGLNPEQECKARLLPQDKLQWIQVVQQLVNPSSCSLTGSHHYVLMVGDGINDSTSLAAATIGVAMGQTGAAMTISAASIVLMNENLRMIPLCIQLGRLARRRILLGISFAILVKIFSIVFAILGYLQLWHAIVIDIGTLVIVLAWGSSIFYTDPFKTNNDMNGRSVEMVVDIDDEEGVNIV